MIGLQRIDLIWAASDQSDQTVGDLLKAPPGYGQGVSSDLPRAVIVSGISEKEPIEQ